METKLKNNVIFDTLIENMSNDILNDTHLNKETVKEKIKYQILTNIKTIYECFCNKLELDIDNMKNSMFRSLKNNKKNEYIQKGILLSCLNKRHKKFKMKNELENYKERMVVFKNALIDNGHEDIYDKYRHHLHWGTYEKTE
tara:strand:- start:86 stop:511 length:426 start_codon:yes stop_codon:yes gene_type:complete